MFTGIIETLGKIENIEHDKSNIHFYVSSAISNELKIDQSVSHNGVCLTVVGLNNDLHQVTAIDETLQKTNLAQLSSQFSVARVGRENSLLIGCRSSRQ